MKAKWIGSPNFSTGRNGQKVVAIVVHVIEGTLASCDNWFRNPVSKVSAHYGIGRHGEVHQYVNEDDTAWHAGRVDKPTWKGVKPGANPNHTTIGIEHEGTATSTWTDAQYEASATLVAEICQRHGIPCDRAHVVGHREIYSKKTCPGRGDIDRIVRTAAAKMAAGQCAE